MYKHPCNAVVFLLAIVLPSSSDGDLLLQELPPAPSVLFAILYEFDLKEPDLGRCARFLMFLSWVPYMTVPMLLYGYVKLSSLQNANTILLLQTYGIGTAESNFFPYF